MLLRLFRISLRKKTFALVAALVVLVLFLFSLVGVRAVEQSTQRMLQERLAMAELAAAHVDHILSLAQRELARAAASPAINLADGDGEPEERLLRELYSRSQLFDRGVALIGPRGQVLRKEPPDAALPGDPLGQAPYWPQPFKIGQPTVSNAITSGGDGRPFVALTAPIRGDDGQVGAVLVGCIGLDHLGLTTFLSSVALGETGYIEIIDEEGFVLASTQPQYLYRKSDHPEQFARLIAGRQTIISTCHSCHQTGATVRKESEVLAFAPLSLAPWGIAVRQAEAEALAPTWQFLWQTLGVGAASFLAAASLIWLASRNLLKRLGSLTEASRRIAGGDLEGVIPTAGQDEVGALASAFDEMRVKLKASRDQQERWSDSLESTVQQRTRELSTLLEMSTASVSAGDLESLLDAVMRKAVEAFSAADAGTLFLYDAGQDALIPRACVGYDLVPLSEVRLKAGEAILGKVFQSAQPMLCATPEEVVESIRDMSERNRLHFAQARTGLQQPQAAICAPLTVRNTTIGSLILVNLRQPGTFQAEDLRLLQAVANHIAAVVENARLREEAGEARALREAAALKDEFLSSISHELLTPLTSVKAAAHLLLARNAEAGDEVSTSLLRNIGRNAERVIGLIGDLLDMASLQSGSIPLTKRSFPLVQALNNALAAVKPQADRDGQPIELSLPSSLPDLSGDQRRLEQVLVNLLSNACQHTPKGTRIAVAAEERDSEFIISVSDSGPGIPAAEQALVFQKFYSRTRTKRRKRGAGLGLAIAKAIVELHGGRIWVESQLGKGSTFYVALPKGGSGEDTDSG